MSMSRTLSTRLSNDRAASEYGTTRPVGVEEGADLGCDAVDVGMAIVDIDLEQTAFQSGQQEQREPVVRLGVASSACQPFAGSPLGIVG